MFMDKKCAEKGVYCSINYSEGILAYCLPESEGKILPAFQVILA